MIHGPGEGLEATDLCFEWVLGLTVFAGGLGEEQLIRNKNRGNKIFLTILLIRFILNEQFSLISMKAII
jgi:hypothetical protein